MRDEYEQAMSQWQAVPAGAFEGIEDDARDLDAWYEAHREDADPATENPVSDLL